MLEPRQRTALDGKTYWCVFDTDTLKWSTLTCFGKYKRKKDCQYDIDRKQNNLRIRIWFIERSSGYEN